MCFGNNLGNLSSEPLYPVQPPLFIAHCRQPGCRRWFHAVEEVAALEAMEHHHASAHQEQKES